jgi:hypothetical protein
MKKQDFIKKVRKYGFDEAMGELYDELDCITDYDQLKDYIIDCIKRDDNHLALHLLNSIYNSDGNSNWYYYEFSEGTMCTPVCLNTIKDVEDLGLFE